MKASNEKQENLQLNFEKAKLDLLRRNLKKTYKERFQTMTRLMRMGLLFKSAKIIHKYSA